MNQNMAAAMELRCWGGDWGLPSVHTESLIVLVSSQPVYKHNTLSAPGAAFKTARHVSGLLCVSSLVLCG